MWFTKIFLCQIFPVCSSWITTSLCIYMLLTLFTIVNGVVGTRIREGIDRGESQLTTSKLLNSIMITWRSHDAVFTLVVCSWGQQVSRKFACSERAPKGECSIRVFCIFELLQYVFVFLLQLFSYRIAEDIPYSGFL